MSEFVNLLVILKLFNNRPHHLLKFLSDNKALNPDFLNKISESEKLSEIKKNGLGDTHLHFKNISEMKNYYSSLIDDLENLKKKKTKEELTLELNNKLTKAIELEDYEEASRIRDYMKINNIKRSNKL
jgi:hypothetical protein